MKKFVTQQQQLFITKTENEFVKQVKKRIIRFLLEIKSFFFYTGI